MKEIPYDFTHPNLKIRSPHWLAGFIEGDGSFYMSLSHKDLNGLVPSFVLTQKESLNEEIL